MRVFAIPAACFVLAVLAPTTAVASTRKKVVSKAGALKLRKEEQRRRTLAASSTAEPADSEKKSTESTASESDSEESSTLVEEVIPEIDFATATTGEWVVYLAATDEAETAIEHFHEMPMDAEKTDPKVLRSYAKAMMKFVPFDGAQDATWTHIQPRFTDSQKVRALWGANDLDGAIALYESSKACQSDPKAKAAYLDAKLKKDFPAIAFPAMKFPAKSGN